MLDALKLYCKFAFQFYIVRMSVIWIWINLTTDKFFARLESIQEQKVGKFFCKYLFVHQLVHLSLVVHTLGHSSLAKECLIYDEPGHGKSMTRLSEHEALFQSWNNASVTDLQKVIFSQNSTVRLIFSYLHLFINIVFESFMQKNSRVIYF